ncbi:hypothetical protein POVWA2_052770 [Plasmodium ovale wallikeri]|uniref:Uncharacterized protein n=1 Tax=Plasmodium ovale wallikeri TaxID=864142 RepID=A0A1A8ZSG4_PLAOA|nr:hypothetical protein POVWA1_053500 [Plasmodium ovale wallikeri]SBT46830.1 hypothetical protein POVWA2_052770 [Plasmodium ovale wallikeri]
MAFLYISDLFISFFYLIFRHEQSSKQSRRKEKRKHTSVILGTILPSTHFEGRGRGVPPPPPTLFPPSRQTLFEENRSGYILAHISGLIVECITMTEASNCVFEEEEDSQHVPPSSPPFWQY